MLDRLTPMLRLTLHKWWPLVPRIRPLVPRIRPLVPRGMRCVSRLLPRINLSHVSSLPFALNTANCILITINDNLTRQIIILTYPANLGITSTESTLKTHHFNLPKISGKTHYQFFTSMKDPLSCTLRS